MLPADVPTVIGSAGNFNWLTITAAKSSGIAADFPTPVCSAGNIDWLTLPAAKSSGIPANIFPQENPMENWEILVVDTCQDSNSITWMQF